MSDRPLRPRPLSMVQRSMEPSDSPPVPTRKESLPKSSSSPSIPLKPSISGTSVAGAIRTMSHVETLVDNQAVATTFEDKSLCRESFRTLDEFYQNQTLCDIEIHVGSKVIPCHKVVLACVSQYFRSMFTSEMAESRKSSITINDIDENALQQLIHFAYTATIVLTTDNVQSLLYASSILQVETVASACCEFMKTHLDSSNSIAVRNFAEQHGRTELMEKADQFIRDHFLDVVESEEYPNMSVKHLQRLLGSRDLNVRCERQVFEAAMKWIRHNVDSRKQFLPQLMCLVKLPLLPTAYLMHEVRSDELLRSDEKCRDYLDEANYYKLCLAQVVPQVELSEKILPRKSCAGVVFCVGGRGASGDPFKSIECFDLRKDHWFPVSEMSCKRRHVGVVSVDGKLYAVGGHDGKEHLKSGEVFDPLLNRWSPIAPMVTLRRGLALACLGGPIYAVGGLDDTICFNVVERYDPESDTWSTVQSMNLPRGGVAVAALKGHIYALGGNNGSASLESCEKYDPHLNKWTMVAPMNKRRAGAGVASLNGQLYIVGGFDDNSPLDSVERYDPITNEWTMLKEMSCPRGGVGVTELGGQIFAVGGHDGTNYLSSVETYDSFNDSWHLVANISTCRAGAGIAVVDCHIALLKDVSKVNMSGAGNGKKHPKLCCTVKCSIVAHTSIIYPEESSTGRL